MDHEWAEKVNRIRYIVNRRIYNCTGSCEYSVFRTSTLFLY